MQDILFAYSQHVFADAVIAMLKAGVFASGTENHILFDQVQEKCSPLAASRKRERGQSPKVVSLRQTVSKARN